MSTQKSNNNDNLHLRDSVSKFTTTKSPYFIIDLLFVYFHYFVIDREYTPEMANSKFYFVLFLRKNLLFTPKLYHKCTRNKLELN